MLDSAQLELGNASATAARMKSPIPESRLGWRILVVEPAPAGQLPIGAFRMKAQLTICQ
jgi:hypothetical protein